jgi:hypothetical protein
MKYIQAQIEDDYYLELKEFVVKRGLAMNNLLLTALAEYIENTKRKEDIEEVVTETLSSLEERNLSKEDSNE